MLTGLVGALSNLPVFECFFMLSKPRVWVGKTAWIEHLGTPVWMAIHFAFIVSVLFKKEITWAGIRYRVRVGGNTSVISRES